MVMWTGFYFYSIFLGLDILPVLVLCRWNKCSLKENRSKPRHSRIHVVPLPVFFLVWRRRRRRFLLDQIFPVQRAGGVQLQPGGDAFQIEHVGFVAREADDEGVFVCQDDVSEERERKVRVRAVVEHTV